MQVNMQMGGSFNGESDQGSNSDDGQIILALRKMVEKEIEVRVIHTVHRVIEPIVENLMRKVVKEEILSAQEKLLTGENRNNHTDERIMSRERNLGLKFLDDEVSSPVLTGEKIKGKGGNYMMVALVDKNTGGFVKCGPESSAQVEILVLDSSGDDEHNWSFKDFNDMIIKEGDKKKPHFAKCNYIYLKEGIGFLNNSKLSHGSDWINRCKCRLGARIVRNFDGIRVQEAWTKSFLVSDRRSTLYGKSELPSLTDEIWRLKSIGKDGAPCKNLNKMNISTVKDFLFLHSVNPERLQKIAAGAKGKTTLAKWKVTVDHAQTCIIDDNKIYLYCPSSESKTGVTFNVVGGLKGLIHDSHYVPINDLSEDEKAHARELLQSAYENQKDISDFVDEASLLQKYPYKSSDINGCDLTTSETINGYDPTEPGVSRQSITPTVNHSGSIVQISMGQSHDPHLEIPNWAPSCSVSNFKAGTSSQSTNMILGLDSFGLITVCEPHLPYHGSSSFSFDLDPSLERFVDNENLMAATFPETYNVPQTLEAKSHSHPQSNATRIHLIEVMDAVIWMVRAGQRFMAQRNIRVRKRRKIHEEVAYGGLV
ncbi:hypothetical protein BUALT_Bualt07G0041800 [Buddleja alternifolia]|uniref:Calmodulin-binding protein n=1 Tax=Buddleja alternifolia TaxID=168488 RepID=A0AAV6XIV7_9LAMI|nr:hypothetical protein BUALT_Bualt07G0041800 [Buddleja alternifolia]